MADSLLDFGNITKLAQQNLQNAMHMQQLSLQEEQGQRAAQQLKINEQNATTEHINALGNFLKDENVKFDPNLTGAIVNKISSLAGGPKVDMDSIMVGRQAKIDYAHGLMTGNMELADQGLKGYAVAATPDQLDNLIKTTVQYPKLNEELLALKQKRMEDTEKFEKIQYDNARVSIGRPLYTGLANSFREQTNIPDRRSFEAMQNLYEKARETGKGVQEILGGKQLPGVNKANLSSMLNGNFGEAARLDGIRLDALKEETSRLKQMLDSADHGTPLPSDVTKPMLRAQIEANDVTYGAMVSMKEWHEEPFDKQKYKAAVAAGRTLEDHRLKIEDLDKNTHADTIKIQQETLAFHQDQQRNKDEQAAAKAEGQRRWLALPERQRTDAAAGKISQALKEELGVDVLPADIYHNPNSPQNSTTINNVMGKAETAYSTKFNQNLAEKDSELYDQATKAPEIHDRASRVIDVLTNQKTITGFGADFRLSMAKALKVAGLSDSDAPENTEALFTDLASNTLAQVKASGLGAGNGFTNTDRDYLEKATGGRISLEKDSLLKIAKIAQRVQELTVDKWNKRVKQLPDSAIQPGGITREPMVIPKYQPQSGKASSSGKAQPSPTIPIIKSAEDYEKLKPDTVYIAPDGSRRTKR